MKSDLELITELQERVGELEQAGARLGELLDQARAEVLKLTDQRDVARAELGREELEHYLTKNNLTHIHRALIERDPMQLYAAGFGVANWQRNQAEVENAKREEARRKEAGK